MKRRFLASQSDITATTASENSQTLDTFLQLATPLLGAEDAQANKFMSSSVRDSVVIGSHLMSFLKLSARETK